MRHPKPISFQYICGFFDGEGNIAKPLVKKAPTVSIAQSDGQHLVLFAIQAFLERHRISCNVHRKETDDPRHKAIWRLVISDRASIIRFLRAMRPYCWVKLSQLETALRNLRITEWKHGLVDLRRCERSRLAYYEGYTFREAAAVSGIDAHTLRHYMLKRGERGRSREDAQLQGRIRKVGECAYLLQNI